MEFEVRAKADAIRLKRWFKKKNILSIYQSIHKTRINSTSLYTYAKIPIRVIPHIHKFTICMASLKRWKCITRIIPHPLLNESKNMLVLITFYRCRYEKTIQSAEKIWENITRVCLYQKTFEDLRVQHYRCMMNVNQPQKDG